jgi:CheY-like chemotaxis protein
MSLGGLKVALAGADWRCAELTRFALHVIEDDTEYLMGKRILVADDSRTIQQAFAMVMDGSSYALSFARSVDEALAAVKRDGRPDLVLSDAVLGNGSGYDLCAQLKAESALREVPVYILASNQNPYDEARGRKVGADGHLAKPFESQALLDAVASALAAPMARPSAAPQARMIDFGDSTARVSERDLPVDDDSYGEIVIERGPSQAPVATNWTARPPSRPSVARPAALGVPTPAPPAAARPPMIPGMRPSAAMPVAPAAAPAEPRPVYRTMMGFPSVKPPVAGARSAPPLAAPAPPMSSRPATLPPATAVPPLRVPTFATPAASVAPVARVTQSPPGLPSPSPVALPRPSVSRPTPPPAAAQVMVPQQALPSTRKVLTPAPPAAPAAVVSTPPPDVAAVVTSVMGQVDHKMVEIASRGPEYEAIAKLSREVIEQVVWEVVPELAEVIIRQEVDRLASAKK